MTQARRLVWFVLSTVLLCALLGGVYGRQVEATAGTDDSDVKAVYNSFTQVYDVVEKNYADPVDPDAAIFGPPNSNAGAIPAALRTLDPHSNFFDPHAFALLREDQEGKYYGVGMSIQSRPGKMGKLVTVVLAPIPGSPAFRAGLRPGDIVAKVDGKPTDGLNTSQVAEMLKGPKGTLVHVTIQREGYEQPIEVDITRDEISQKSVDDAFLIRPNIAYIHINKFNENTNDELVDALRKVGEKNLQGLILDLRGNPGGLLQEAVEVSDHFLEKSQLIVYHSGRHSQEKRYYATHGDDGNEYPIVVLINRLTASAAEIVTGALQDHDRALVIGEPSFGKGLVQTVYQLSEHTGLALTTAHYYTPSGRLIQRQYENVSLYDYYYHPELTKPAHAEVRLTDGGREVYGGGGITPDIQFSDPKMNSAQDLLLQHSAFFNFAKYYLGIHKSIPKDFEVTDNVLDEFKQFLGKEKISLSDVDMTANLDFIKNRIRIQLVASIYGEVEADRISIANDPIVQKSLDNMPQAKELMAKAKRYIASKTQR
ncbi:MAG TPA: S41 family peptidase [Terriglobia bacterium]|nr:S41 family peptidase [Terriglobia bacterium]